MNRLLNTLRMRVRSLFRSTAADRELARELRAHLDEEIAANVADGMTPDEARRAAAHAFGSMAAIEEACRDTRRVRWIENIARDLRYAGRMLARQPGFFLAAVASLGLGAGATLTIFALANHLLLSVPTAIRPHELVHIRTGNGSHVSYRGWQQLDESGVLAAIAGYQFEQSVNWRRGDDTVTLVPLLVTANFFDVVGPPMALGRGFVAEEAAAERDPRLVVLSHGFWQRRLGGDPATIGRTLTLNGEAYTITGVLAAGLRSIAGYGLAPEVYVPLNRALVPALDRPRTSAAQLVGRLRAGQSLAAGRAAVATVAARIGEADGDPEFQAITVFTPVGGLSQVRDLRAVGAFFVVLFIVSGLVLAIACANVAGLLLARGLARRREIAMRVALGAGRGRLVQQLLTESLVLGGAGALAGLGLAALAFLLLRRLTLPVPLPVELQFTLDWRLTLLTLGLIVATTCLAGLAPAMQTSRAALGPAIKLHERRFLRRVTLRGLLVTGQVTISLLLLIAALTFVRNLARASTVDPGFDVDRVLVAQVSFVEGRQGTADRPAAEAMAERARELPGVAGAAISEGVPLTIFAGRRTGTEVRIDGRDGLVRVDYDGMLVGPGYFETMGIRLLRGRDFTAADRPQAAPVVIINEEFALRYFPGLDPLGRRIADAYGSRPAQEVVGIVSNGKYHSLAESQDAAIYDPMLQMASPGRFVHLLVRTRGAPDTVAPVLRQAILAADDSAAVTLTPMRNALAFALLPSQIGSALLGLLGALGTGLAMVGLFGVVSFTVSRRTAEIAVRSALGASRRAVLLLVMRDAARLVGGGVAVGLPLAWFVLSPLAAFLVVGVTPLDPSSVAGAVVLLACASLAAVWGPARRALGISPCVALRLE